jgi:transcriptional regulator with XRE-family HTH domain/predicted transcriptional regulator
MASTLNLRTIFGIKLKQLRERRHLTLMELGRSCGLSASYLAEIEAGKKYPKAEKVWRIAEALGCTYDELISTKLGNEFSELQEFLTSPGVRDFPFDRFGLPAGDLMKLLARSPHEVAALIRTVGDLARQHNVGVEQFLHAALRCYQELTGNYYEPIEEQADAFASRVAGGTRGPAPYDALVGYLRNQYDCPVDEETIGTRPALAGFRAVLATGPSPRLLLNPALTESQKAYVVAREVGYRVLDLHPRSLTTPPDRERSFDQVLNDFKAAYFASAVLLPRDRLIPDLRAFFRLPTWQAEALLRLLDRHRVTAETLMYRLSQLVPSQFGLRAHFLKFNDERGYFRLVKQLNLSDLPIPPGIGGTEHYCRRWLSTRLLVEAATWRRRRARHARRPLVDAQRSRFPDGKEFLCIGLAQPQALRPEVTTSLTLGFMADARLFDTVKFAGDRTIAEALISGTCERCPFDAADCADRAAAPVLHLESEARAERDRELEKLIS